MKGGFQEEKEKQQVATANPRTLVPQADPGRCHRMLRKIGESLSWRKFF